METQQNNCLRLHKPKCQKFKIDSKNKSLAPTTKEATELRLMSKNVNANSSSDSSFESSSSISGSVFKTLPKKTSLKKEIRINTNTNTNASSMLKTATDFKRFRYKPPQIKKVNEQFINNSHSILLKFHNEIKKNLISSVNQQKRSINSVLRRKDPYIFQKFHKKKRNRAISISSNINTLTAQNNTKNNNIINVDNINEQSNLEEQQETIKIQIQKSPIFSESNQMLKLRELTEPGSIRIDPNLKSFKRRRTFAKFINEKSIMTSKWKQNNGIFRNEMKLSLFLIKDLKFQSNYIKDELIVLIDDHNYLKMSVFASSDFITSFKNKNFKSQREVNELFEETIAYIDLIPKIILGDYYNYSDRYISVEPANEEDFEEIDVENEVDCLIKNIKLIKKVFAFLKCSYEAYSMLVNQVNDMLLTPYKFKLVRKLLEKSRFNTNQIMLLGKSSIKLYNNDKKIIENYQKLVNKKTNLTRNQIENVGNAKMELNQKMAMQLQFGKNEITQKKLRVTNALNENKNDDNGESENQGNMPYSKNRKMLLEEMAIYYGPMSVIKSSLMTKMLKYFDREQREKVMAMRIVDKYEEKDDVIQIDGIF